MLNSNLAVGSHPQRSKAFITLTDFSAFILQNYSLCGRWDLDTVLGKKKVMGKMLQCQFFSVTPYVLVITERL